MSTRIRRIGLCAALAIVPASGPARAQGPAMPPPAAAEDRPALPGGEDVPTRVAALIEESQAEFADQPNQWRLFVDITARYAGMSRYAALTMPRMRRLVGEGERAAAEEFLFALSAPGEPDPVLVEEARSLLTMLEEAGLFRDLDELTRDCRFVPDRSSEPLIYTREPHLGNARQLAKLLVVKMRLERDVWGGGEEFARALGHALALSRACCCTGSGVAYSVGLGIRDTALRQVRAALLEGGPSPRVVQAASIALDRSALIDPRLIVECERVKTLDEAAAIFEKLRRQVAGAEQAADALAASRRSSMEVLAAAFDAWRDVLGEDPDLVARAMESLVAIEQRSSSVVDPVSRSVLAALFPRTRDMCAAVGVSRTDLIGTRTMLALERFRAATGDYPAALDELIPGHLAALPPDPWDARRPIGFRRIDAATDGLGRTYILYSVGADREDNGGTAASPAADAIRSRSRGKGTDYILNQAE